MKLSMVVPSIRKDRCLDFYNSVTKSFSGDWELILIGPYKLDFERTNMRWIESWASPTVAQHIGLIEAKGDYVCFGWDDGLYCEGSLDKAFELMGDKIAVSGKYIEGDIAPAYMRSNKYYIINNHDKASSPYITNDFLLFNTGIVSRETLLEIGGFDCRFEATALAFVDLSIRLQLYGIKVILMEEVMMTCTWLPGDEGDHEPVNKAVEYDFSLLHKKYRQPIFHKRVIIDIDNWKLQPSKWERRFK